MAKTKIERACGHVETIQLHGPYKQRDYRASFEESRDCSDCYAIKIAAQRAAENQAAAEAAKAAHMPALIGSEKQIAWAESIRAKAAKQLAQTRADLCRETGVPHDRLERVLRLLDEATAAIMARTNASAWIDTRMRTYDKLWLYERWKRKLKETVQGPLTTPPTAI